jgi:hypothetical protein
MIEVQNEIVKDYCRRNGWCFLEINNQLYRDDYTAHGLHLNKKGKRYLTSIIHSELTSRSRLGGRKSFLG